MYNFNEGFLTLIPDSIAFYPDFTWIKAYTRKSIQKYNLNWPEGLTFEDGEFYFKYYSQCYAAEHDNALRDVSQWRQPCGISLREQ